MPHHISGSLFLSFTFFFGSALGLTLSPIYFIRQQRFNKRCDERNLTLSEKKIVIEGRVKKLDQLLSAPLTKKPCCAFTYHAEKNKYTYFLLTEAVDFIFMDQNVVFGKPAEKARVFYLFRYKCI